MIGLYGKFTECIIDRDDITASICRPAHGTRVHAEDVNAATCDAISLYIHNAGANVCFLARGSFYSEHAYKLKHVETLVAKLGKLPPSAPDCQLLR